MTRLLALVLLWLGSVAGAVPVSLHVLLDRSGGVGVAARLSVGDRTYDLEPDGLLLDLPAGQYPVRLLTAGGRLVPDEAGNQTTGSQTAGNQTTLTVTAPVTEKDLIVEPSVPLKLSLPATVVAGQPFAAQLDVQNTYGLPLTLTPLLRLPDGVLALSDLRSVLTLQSGETGSLQVRLVAAQTGPVKIDGGLNETSGLSQAEAVVEAPAPTAQPSVQLPVSADAGLDADPADPLPGEVVTFHLKLRNPGAAPLTVRATPTLPDWIAPEEGSQPQTLSLPGSGEASLTFTGRVGFGPVQAGTVGVRLDGWSGPGSAQVQLRRQLLGVQVAQPDEGTVGERGSVVALVQNPTARPQQVILRGSGAAATLEPVTLSLDAYGRATGELGLTPGQSGRQAFTVTALTTLPDGSPLPVSLPSGSEVRASEAVQERRVASIRQPFSLRGVPGLDDPASAVTLLAVQDLPEGVLYQSGSSQLNGRALPDPQVGNAGRLYWALGRPPLDGVLSYRVASTEEAPALAPLALTASVGGKDLYLSGEVPSSELQTAAAVPEGESGGLIRLPRQGTVLRGQDKTAVVLEGPAGVPVTLSVNGAAVPDALLGEETVTLGRRRLSYAGVALKPGLNVLEAHYGDLSDRLEVNVAGTPVRLVVDASGAVADGASPVVVKILALDARGLSSGDGTLTVDTDLEPVLPDADPREPGYQVVMQGGVAVLRLQPLLSARRLRVAAALGRLTTSQEVFVDVQLRTRYVYQASFGVRFGGGTADGGLSLDAAARGYAELPVLDGQLQAAADSDGLPRFLGGNGVTGAQTAADLGRFPLTGSGTESRGALSSDLGLAFRYERRELSLGYYTAGVSLSPLPALPSFSALRAEVREVGGSPFSVRAFVGQLPSGGRTETFIPDGRRSYMLSELPRLGSTVVTVVAGGLSRTLVIGRDYLVDDGTGTVVLAAPLSRYDENFVPQTLTVLYLPLASTATVLTYGGSLSYASGPWSVDVAAVQLRGAAPIDTGESDFSLAYGAQLAYRTPALQAALNYNVTSFDPSGKLGLSGSYLAPDGNVAGSVELSSSDRTGLVGTAEVSARLSEFRVRLSHLSLGVATATATTPALTSQRTTLTLERAVRPGLTLGGGLEYAWTPDTALQDGGAGLSGVVLARYEQGDSSVELQHAQPFSVASGLNAQTRLTGSLALTPTTFLEGRVIRIWDGLGTLSGEIGVRQTLGNVNYTVTYQLPGVSGESSRARFGVAAPIAITDRVSANVSASLLRDLGDGIYTASGTLGVRYRTDTFTATASVEGGRDFGADAGGTADGATGTSGSRLTLRGGATGTVGDQDLSLDAAYTLLPTPGGQFTFSYARRTDVLATLAYLRLNTGTGVGSINPDGGTLLEGEVQLSSQPWLGRPDMSPALNGLELQPGVAFRLPFGSLSELAVQVGLGVSVPVTPQLALAATGYLFYQPLGQGDASGSPLSAAYALDLKYTVSPGLRLVAGYTVSQVSALTPDARPGFHIRAELYGGRP